MGSLFACALAGAGHRVSLLCRRRVQAQAIGERGLAIATPTAGLRVFRPEATADPDHIGPVDLVLVCCKSYDTAAAATSLPALMHQDTIVLTMQNGLGNVETLSQAAPREHVLAGVTHQGAYVSGPGRIDHAGSGETVIGQPGGPAGDQARVLAEALTAAGLPCSVSDNIRGVQWAKLLTNVAINPLTAILQVSNGGLLDLPDALIIARRAAGEGEEVACAAGVDLPDHASQLWVAITTTVRRTADNRSSMLQDVLCGRRTEIDSINGAIVSIGARLGIPTPVNQTLTSLVKALTNHKPHRSPEG